jgi:hypothetical protein
MESPKGEGTIDTWSTEQILDDLEMVLVSILISTSVILS